MMNEADIQKLRQEYTKHSLGESDVAENPHQQFEKWFKEALEVSGFEANAFHLATVDAENKPHIRVLLLKGLEGNEFKFYTNFASNKGKEIEANPSVSMCFFWGALERQVRIDGVATKIPHEESEAYFKTRPHLSQIGAHTSNQSEQVPDRDFLDQKFKAKMAAFEEGNVPMPETWGGYKIVATEIEFWQGRPGRLHDRIVYSLHEGSWSTKRLSP